MNNNLKFDFDKPLGDMNSSKEQDNVVIQCSFCATRYAIPAESLKSADCPKFHCFSCDNIFEVNFSQNTDSLINDTSVKLQPLEEKGDRRQESISAQMSQQLLGDGKDSTFSSQKNTAFGFNSSLKITSEASVANARSKKEESLANSRLNFALSNKSAVHPAPNVDSSTPRKSFVFTDFQKSLKISDNSLQNEEALGHSWGAPRASSTQKESSNKVATVLSGLSFPKINTKKFSFDAKNLTFPKMAMPSLEMPNFSIPQGAFSLARRDQMAFSTKFFLVLAPILAVLFLLYLLTNIILTAPQSFATYFSGAMQSVKNYPYAGVGVKSLDYKLVKLDNGEELAMFAGEFYNNSGKVVNNPIIEGVLFGSQGQILSRSFHTLDKDLSKVHFQSLDSRTLTELPKSKESDKFVLKPNQKQHFVFALSADSKVQPSYFTGRVYSIS